MSASTETLDNKKIWGGNTSPFGISYGKMMMWFFLVSDAFTFTGFLVAYGYMRHRFEEVWPVAENVFTHFPFMHGDHPLLYVALMTFILIMSSVTMVLAVLFSGLSQDNSRSDKDFHLCSINDFWSVNCFQIFSIALSLPFPIHNCMGC